MKRVLIIGAHYDDTELGVGGTAAKLVSEGKQVHKLTLTDNVTRFSHMNVNVEYETSVAQSSAACRILGVDEIESFSPLKCNTLTYDTEIMQRIENILFEKEIDTVFMHYPYDMNQDHIASSKLCMTASRHCKNVFMYQSNLYILENHYYPNYFFDISKFIDLKIKALEEYGNEHNRFSKLFQMNVERNHVWGYSNKVEYAEGFSIVRRLE